MDDISRLNTENLRGKRAKQLLEDPLIKESFDLLERELVEGLIATPADEAVKREKLHMMLVYGRKWRNTFQIMIESGTLAQFDLDERRKFKLWGR